MPQQDSTKETQQKPEETNKTEREGGGQPPKEQTEEPKTKEKKEKQEEKEQESPKKQEEVQKTRAGIQKKQKKKGGSSVKKPRQKDELTEEIESILEQDLEDAYKELTPVQQQEFKMKGEETAQKIRNLIKQGKAKVKKIFQLIFEWLKTLPGVNKYFLEQEAKIKADKIVKLEQTQKPEKSEEEKDINIKEG